MNDDAFFLLWLLGIVSIMLAGGVLFYWGLVLVRAWYWHRMGYSWGYSFHKARGELL